MSSNNIPLKLLRGYKDNLPTTIEDGMIYYCIDSNELFFDYVNDSIGHRYCLNPIVGETNYGDPVGKGLVSPEDKEIIDTAVRFVEQNLGLEQQKQARLNINAVGEKTLEGGEIFNDYENNVASAEYAHAEGTRTSATGLYSHAEGEGTQASGYASHAEGSGSASSKYAHAEGHNTSASGHHSHAEGQHTRATEYAAHSEGDETVASGLGAHSEGAGTEASGYASHAEGSGSKAIGAQAHAEGHQTIANGDYSHTEGNWTIASGSEQHVQGKYNIEDTESKYAHIVGNGDNYTARSNAHTLDWEGNAWFAGDVYVKGLGQDDTENVHKLSYDSIEQQNANSPHKNIKFWVGTQEELDTIEDRQDDCLYFTTGEGEDEESNTTYEKLENKTNVISENSTDEQYPSAKAVHTAISNINLPYSYGTEDLVAGETPLAEGHLYFVYE